MIPKNILIALIGTGVIAIIVEGYKFIRRRLKKATLDARALQSKQALVDHIGIKSKFNKNKAFIPYNFGDLIFESYLIYLSKMASTITKTSIYYDIEEDDDTIYFIEGVTSDKTRILIRNLIKQEVRVTVDCRIKYCNLLDMDIETFNQYVEYAIDYIEDSLDFQMVCSEIVLNELK